jgi:hypothetical protein
LHVLPVDAKPAGSPVKLSVESPAPVRSLEARIDQPPLDLREVPDMFTRVLRFVVIVGVAVVLGYIVSILAVTAMSRSLR